MNALMEQYSSYKILTSKELIIEYYYGEVTKDVIIDMKMNIINDIEYNPEYNSMLDFRDSVMTMNHDDIIDVINYIYENISLKSTRRIALLTNTPNHVVVTTLFINFSKKLKMQYRIFSTLKAATSWVIRSDKFKLVIKTIDNLRI